MKAYSDLRTYPKGQGVEVRVEGNTLRVFFDFEEISIPNHEAGEKKPKTVKQLKYESIDVVGGRAYPDIVSAIVRDRYSDNEIQAILANYAEVNNTASVLILTPEKKEEYLQEYADFQQWRAHAKEIAHVVITLI